MGSARVLPGPALECLLRVPHHEDLPAAL
jgi:hypothetical protein